MSIKDWMNEDFDRDELDGESVIDRVEAALAGQPSEVGAIIPFPDEFTRQGFARALRGISRSRHDKETAAGYRDSYFYYTDAEGRILQMILRRDHPSERKIIRPYLFVGHGDLGPVLTSRAIRGQRPLYNLHALAARPDVPVLVVEGEKTADAAASLFPDHVVTTWMSGASSVPRTELQPLAGRNLVLWPDNDIPGRKAMRTFAACAFAAGAASINMVDVPREFGEKWDLADAVPPAVADLYPLNKLVSTARLVDPATVSLANLDNRRAAESRRLLGYKPGYSRVDIKFVNDALNILDPGMSATEWRQVARSIFYAYGKSGLLPFDAWSRRSTQKYKDGEPTALWAAYEAEQTFRGPSLAWLFRQAQAVLDDPDVSRGRNVKLDDSAVVHAAIEELSEDHAVVIRGGKLTVLWEHFDPRFDRFTLTFLTKRDFVDRHVRSVRLPADDEQQNKRGDKTKKQGQLWIDSARRRTYENVLFAPGKMLDREFLNLWRGFAVEPRDNPDGWNLFKNHLLHNVAQDDPVSFAYIMDWLACMVQRLDEPIGTALVLIGKKGVGKSIVTTIVGHLFGNHTFVTSRMDDVLGRFNDRLETTVLLGLEEAIAPQNRAADGTLKDLITRETLRLEGKFFGVWDAPNHLRIIVTSNNEHVVRADGSERRYAVYDVTNPHQDDPDARRRYFGAMIEQMETGGYEAMLGELLSRDIRSWNPERIPETGALRRQKLHNLANDPVRSYLFDRLAVGVEITAGDVSAATPIRLWSDDNETPVPVRELAADFRLYTQAHGLRFSERMLATQLLQYMPNGFKSTTVRATEGDGSRASLRVYPMPPLEEARQAFEKATGLSFEREVEDH